MSESQVEDPRPDPRLEAAELSAMELRRIRRLMGLAVLLATLTAVYFARAALLPVVLAVVLTLTLLPLVRWGERVHIPRPLMAVILMIGIGIGLVAAGYSLSGPFTEMARDAPRIAAAARDKLGGVMDQLGSIREMTEEVTVAAAAADNEVTGETEATEVEVVVSNDEPGLIEQAVSGAASAGGAVAAALVLTAFLLAAGDFYHRRIVEAAPRLRDKKKALTIIRDVERQISRYLGAITLINIGLGVAVGASLWALGMPTPVLWGVLAFLFNYIPFIGYILNVALVAAVSLVTYDSLWEAALPPLALVALSAIEGNVVTPLVVGRRLELNQVSQLIMVGFWTWLWGIPGAILAVPFLVVVKAVCDNVENLQVISSFLSGDPATKEDEPPDKATTGPALDTAPLRTQAEARDESPPTMAAGDVRVTPLPAP